MGWLDRFWRRRGEQPKKRSGRHQGQRGTWRTIRENYRELPEDQWTDDEHDHFFANLPEEAQWAEWDAWSRHTYQHPTVSKLKRSVLDLARAAATDSHPDEFGALLRVQGDTVTELVLVLAESGGDSVVFNLWSQPVDASIQGSLHSHPDPHPYPSDADFAMFEAHGTIHLILCEPYGPDNWRAYDHTGVPVHLDLVD